MLDEIIERLELIKSEEYTATQMIHNFLMLNSSSVIEVENIIYDFENNDIDIFEAANKIETYIS